MNTTNTTVSPFVEFLGEAIYQFTIIKPLLPTYGHLLVSALFPIYIGSHASLSRPSSAAKPPKKRKDGHESGREEEDEGEKGPQQKMEGLEPSDALMFPLMAGLTLGGLYLVIKWLEDPAILNKILSFYFSQMGIFFAIAFLKDGLLILRSFIFPTRYKHAGKIWRVKQSERVFITATEDNPGLEDVQVRKSPLPGFLGAIPLPNRIREGLWSYRGLAYQKATLRARVCRILDIKGLFDLLDVVSGIVALAVVAYFAFVKKPWWLTNFLGFSFCYGALQFMSPSTFWTGSLILGSLFFYDIYFVFFTPLMVTVATKLDVPIKLLFPRPPSPEAPDVVQLAMLGLGDIVVPGMMVGLALRFDLYMYYKRKGIQKAKAEGNEKGFVKPQYQTATGGWGERFWVRKAPSRGPELEPPYHDARSFPKTYFNASLVGYVIGMISTLIGMQYSKHAQPALLYLVPGVLISLWGTALSKGDIKEMWNFSDAEEDEEETKEQAEKKPTEKKAKDPPRSLLVRLLSGNIKAFSETPEKDEKAATQPKVEEEGAKEETDPSTPVTKNAFDAEESTSKEADKRSDSASREPRGKHDGDEEDRDSELIFFSIRLHRHKKTQQLKKDSSAVSPSSMNEKGEVYVVPVSPGRDGESPAKKRRVSPRHRGS